MVVYAPSAAWWRCQRKWEIMKGTCDYLDALRDHFGVKSDYAIAKKLDVSTGSLGNWRAGRSTFSDEIAFQVADILGLPRSQVYLAIQAERAAKAHNTPLYDALADALQKLGGMAA